MWKSLLEAIRIQYKLYYVKRRLRRYSPEYQRWAIERGKDPTPLVLPLPETSRDSGLRQLGEARGDPKA